MEIDWNKVIEVIVTATPPTIMAWRALRTSKKNQQIGNDTSKVAGEIHTMVNGQSEAMRTELIAQLKAVREEVKTLKEEIGGLKQEVVQLKQKGAAGDTAH